MSSKMASDHINMMPKDQENVMYEGLCRDMLMKIVFY